MDNQTKETESVEKKMAKSLEDVRTFFAKDKFATNNGAVIEEFSDGYARCSIELNESHLNAVGGVQGGVHYMLSDFAFAVATNWKESRTVSLRCDVAYLGTCESVWCVRKLQMNFSVHFDKSFWRCLYAG